MKYIKTYNIFESGESDELLDLLRSDIEEIGLREDDVYVSTCVFVCKKDGYPLSRTKIEWDDTFYNDNNEALRLSNVNNLKIKFSDMYKSNIGLTSYKYKKTPELNKKGVAIFYGPTFDESFNSGIEISDDETAYVKNTRMTEKIFNELNKERFNSFGYDYVISTDSVGRKLILIFKIGGEVKGTIKSSWNPLSDID